MPDLEDPNMTEAGCIFGVACFALTWVMLGYGEDIATGAKFGGLMSLGFAIAFSLRAVRRGALAGQPIWPAAPQRDGAELVFTRAVSKPVDADVWFAQALAGLSSCLLALSLMLPLVVAA